MLVCALQSGSNGNCTYVEAGAVKLLFDAGISLHRANTRLARWNRTLRGLHGLIISHGHGDHIRCAGTFHRTLGAPLHATRGSIDAMRNLLPKRRDVRCFRPGDVLDFDGVVVRTIPTPHDADESVAFVIEHAGRRLGLLTDLGCPTLELAAAMPTLDAVIIESNYDPQMLANGPYHDDLKARIRNGRGHLSNTQAAELLALCDRGRLTWALLAHLSEHNNDPQLALATNRRVLGDAFPLAVAYRDTPTGMLEV